MRTYERSGVVLDRCTECGGSFLDRGELERLIDAESRYDDDRGRREEGRHGDDDDRRSSGRRRRGSFLGDLLDFG